MKQFGRTVLIIIILTFVVALTGCSPDKGNVQEEQSVASVQEQQEEQSTPVILESSSEVILDIQNQTPSASATEE